MLEDWLSSRNPAVNNIDKACQLYIAMLQTIPTIPQLEMTILLTHESVGQLFGLETPGRYSTDSICNYSL